MPYHIHLPSIYNRSFGDVRPPFLVNDQPTPSSIPPPTDTAAPIATDVPAVVPDTPAILPTDSAVQPPPATDTAGIVPTATGGLPVIDPNAVPTASDPNAIPTTTNAVPVPDPNAIPTTTNALPVPDPNAIPTTTGALPVIDPNAVPTTTGALPVIDSNAVPTATNALPVPNPNAPLPTTNPATGAVDPQTGLPIGTREGNADSKPVSSAAIPAASDIAKFPLDPNNGYLRDPVTGKFYYYTTRTPVPEHSSTSGRSAAMEVAHEQRVYI